MKASIEIVAKRLLLDTNLTVLLVVGLLGTQNIRSHKRLQQYDEADFARLSGMIGTSAGLVFCPNVLTETSNLLRYVAEPLRSRLTLELRKLMEATEERYVDSVSAARHPDFIRLGLADSVLLTLSENDSVLVTDDLALYLAAVSAGHDAVNFAHTRDGMAL